MFLAVGKRRSGASSSGRSIGSNAVLAGCQSGLFPYSRKAVETKGLPSIVAIDPTIAFGRPIVAGAGVRTDVISDRFGAGDSPAEMAKDYGVSEENILEALRYERLAA